MEVSITFDFADTAFLFCTTDVTTRELNNTLVVFHMF